MYSQDHYSKSEGNYSTDGFSLNGTSLLIIVSAVILIAGIIFFLNQNNPEQTEKKKENEKIEKPEEHKIQHKDLYNYSVANLEIVAKTSKMQSQREDALYLLLEIYRKRSLLNLYDFYLNHKGEKYTDEALAIVIFKSDSLYAEACRANTEQGWSNFIVSVPEDFQRDAVDRYNEFRWEHTADKWDTEEKAWQQVQLQKGTGAYRRYIKLYPDGPHASEARRTIQRYARNEKIREHNHEIDRQRYKKWIEMYRKGLLR